MRMLLGLILCVVSAVPAFSEDADSIGRRLEFSASIGYARRSPASDWSLWRGGAIVGVGVGYAWTSQVRLEALGGYRMYEKEGVTWVEGEPGSWLLRRLASLTLGASVASRLGDMAHPFISAGVGFYSFRIRYEPEIRASSSETRPGATVAVGVRGGSQGLSPRLELRLHAISPQRLDVYLKDPSRIWELSLGAQFR